MGRKSFIFGEGLAAERTATKACKLLKKLEARGGIEPPNKGFAGLHASTPGQVGGPLPSRALAASAAQPSPDLLPAGFRRPEQLGARSKG